MVDFRECLASILQTVQQSSFLVWNRCWLSKAILLGFLSLYLCSIDSKVDSRKNIRMAPALLLILTLLWSNNHIHLQNDNHPFEWICQILTTVGSFYEIFLHMDLLVVVILMFSGRHPLAPNREMSVPFERSHTVIKSLPCSLKIKCFEIASTQGWVICGVYQFNIIVTGHMCNLLRFLQVA